jgi:hypothetical protein
MVNKMADPSKSSTAAAAAAAAARTSRHRSGPNSCFHNMLLVHFERYNKIKRLASS